MTDTGLTDHSTELARKASALLKDRARDGRDGEDGVTKLVGAGIEARTEMLERQLRHLAQSYKKLAERVAKAEQIPHLTKDDVSAIRQAAEARAATVAKTTIERDIEPLIEELRTNLKFVRETEQHRSGTGNPNSPALAELVTNLVPVVEALQEGTEQLAADQNNFRAELVSTRERIINLDKLQLDMLAASITDQRAAAARALVGNDT